MQVSGAEMGGKLRLTFQQVNYGIIREKKLRFRFP